MAISDNNDKLQNYEATGAEQYVLTPLMKQYYNIKSQYPDALLLFRAGDFYETFGEDAHRASSILGITLTKRANGSASSVPLAGFPYHALDVYLPKLVQAGERVAICEQLEDPKAAKGIVKRGVTELVTPGVSFNDNVLEGKQNTFLAAIYYNKQDVGLAMLDVSTGEFYAAEGKSDYIEKLLSNLPPKELLYSPSQNEQYSTQYGNRYYTYRLDEWAWNTASNREKLQKQLSVQSLKGFGIDNLPLAITAAGAVLHYLEYTRHTDIAHINTIHKIEQEDYVWIDKYTVRNLELFYPLNPGGTSLCDVLDRSFTPIGARMLRRWLALPLRSKEEIDKRLDGVELLANDMSLRNSVGYKLEEVGDPERITAKIAAARVNPREVLQLARSLDAFEAIKSLIEGHSALSWICDGIVVNDELQDKIKTTIAEDPAVAVGKGSVIASGVSVELDELRELSKNSKDYLIDLASRESERTGITSLKISFNNVFGYYIEVRNTHKDKVPSEWVRKQTLVNAERYITEELKVYEEKILGAQEKIDIIESAIFTELVGYLQPFVREIMMSAQAIAKLDALCSFSIVSLDNSYVRPVLDNSDVIDIKDGRHPVIERCLPLGESYIPNDVFLDSTTQQIIIITGPNMAGKSALLRQTALIAMMAQVGCFVPASSAKLGLLDRIFTRVGASDNISAGESTFMVEMLESANILNNITNKSLVLLDEIGRGTSTYDGLSIAWSMVEYLYSKPGARTLFATHYHELNELENRHDRVKNFNVSVKEIDKRVIFLRKLVRGGTEHSFGIHVASMAGMPPSVVHRAKSILKDLESKSGDAHHRGGTVDSSAVSAPSSASNGGDKPTHQLSFFQLDDPTLLGIRKVIDQIDIDDLSPRQALDKLYEIKKMSGLK